MVFAASQRVIQMIDTRRDYEADYIDLTADIVAAYVSNNSLPASALGELLSNVHAAVSGLATGGSGAVAEDKTKKATPAEIKKSITPDVLISFEDGKPYKTLRRHLTIRGLSPETYREKYGLPTDYPMTSASYSAQRSQLARDLGLGQQRKGIAKAASDAPEETASESAPSAPEKRNKARRSQKTAAA